MESTSQVVRLLDEWRARQGFSHRQFARFLGRAESEWANLRANRRPPSEAFVRAALDQAFAAGGPWYRALLDAYKADAEARVAIPA